MYPNIPNSNALSFLIRSSGIPSMTNIGIEISSTCDGTASNCKPPCTANNSD